MAIANSMFDVSGHLCAYIIFSCSTYPILAMRRYYLLYHIRLRQEQKSQMWSLKAVKKKHFYLHMCCKNVLVIQCRTCKKQKKIFIYLRNFNKSSFVNANKVTY